MGQPLGLQPGDLLAPGAAASSAVGVVGASGGAVLEGALASLRNHPKKDRGWQGRGCRTAMRLGNISAMLLFVSLSAISKKLDL